MTSRIPFITSLAPEHAARWRGALEAALPRHRFCDPSALSDEEAGVVQVAVVANPEPEAIRRFPALEWVQSVWAGVDRLVGTVAPDIRIVRLIDPHLAETMAEGVLGHVLYLHRRVPEYLAQQRVKRWRQLEQRRAGDRTVAVLGLGSLGQVCAARLQAAGFRVMGWSRSAHAIDGMETFSGTDTLPIVLGQADIVVILVPLTAMTRGLLDAAALAACKPGAALVNVARGPVVDRTALLRALDDGLLSHAVLDVFDQEPLSESDPLWSHSSITVMPHVAAPTDMGSASTIVAENLRTYFRDGTVPKVVDKSTGY